MGWSVKMKRGAVRSFGLKVNPHTAKPMALTVPQGGFPTQCHWSRGIVSALMLVAIVLTGCSSPLAQRPSRHHHEIAVAWATASATEGFHFPISCPGPEKLVLFGNAKFQVSCDGSEKIKSTVVDLAGDDPASDDPGAAARRKGPLKCYLVVVPEFKAVPGVVTDMRRAIAAKRTGPIDCALIRYE